VDTPRPSPRTNRTRRVRHPVLIGHAASLSQAETALAALTPFTKPSLRLMIRSLTANARLTKRLTRFYAKTHWLVPPRPSRTPPRGAARAGAARLTWRGGPDIYAAPRAAAAVQDATRAAGGAAVGGRWRRGLRGRGLGRRGSDDGLLTRQAVRGAHGARSAPEGSGAAEGVATDGDVMCVLFFRMQAR
jgi:hypothetical protein